MKRSHIGLGIVAMAAASALALTGCTSGGGNDSGTEGGASSAGDGIISVNGGEPQNGLIPTNTNEVNGGKIIDAVFEGLVYYDAEGTTHMGVAESIESEDDVTWTITLREDSVFTDGTPVQAHNFVDAWNYGAALDNAHLSSYFFEPIKGFSYDENVAELPGMTVVDDYTFSVELEEAGPDFPDRLGYSAFYPLPDVAFEDVEAFGQAPIGNGVYKLAEDGWKHDEVINLVKNEDYVGPREVKNNGLEVVLYANLDAAYTDLLADNLDVLDAIPDASLAVYEDDLGDRAVNQAAAIFQSFTIPERLDHFGGEEGKLRRAAISMAIDREEITDVIFEGTRIPATDFTSPVVDGFTEDLEGGEVLEFNPEEAKKLWAEADDISPWSGSFELAYNADGGHQEWVDAIANQLKNNLEIDASGKAYPKFDVLRAEVTDRSIKTAFRTGWQADYPGAFNFIAPLYGTGAGSNDGDYSNSEFDDLLRKAGAAQDRDEKVDFLHKAQEVLLEDLPAIPTWYAGVNGGFSNNVDNVEFGWNSVPYYENIVKK